MEEIPWRLRGDPSLPQRALQPVGRGVAELSSLQTVAAGSEAVDSVEAFNPDGFKEEARRFDLTVRRGVSDLTSGWDLISEAP